MKMQEYLQRIKQLDDKLFRGKVLIAREMTSEEKMMAGPRLFERACELMTQRIRDKYPGADEQQVLKILREALDMSRQLEDLGCRVHLPEW